MKKRSLWFLFMAALLCFTMLFAACDSGDTEVPSSTEGTTDDATEGLAEAETEAALTDEVVDYSAAISEWKKYISAVGPKTEDAISGSSYIVGDGTDADSGISKTIYINGSIATLVNITEPKYNENVLVEGSKKTVNFYNLGTGQALFSSPLTESIYIVGTGVFANSFEIRVLADTIIEVEYIEYENSGTNDAPVWSAEPKVTYSYYDSHGKLLAENMTEEAEYYVDYSCVIINGKAYYCKDSEIAVTNSDVYPYLLKDFTEYSYDSMQYEYKGYTYIMPRAYYNNNKIQVVETATYKLVVDYSIPDYIISDYKVAWLSNGDILLYGVESVDEENDHFDYETQDGVKYNVHNIIISVSTGKATEVESDLVIGKMITNQQTESTGIKLLGDYQYAEVCRIVDGKLDTRKVESVILDNTLKETAKLPEILKNRISLVSGFDGKLIVDAYNDTNYWYVSNGATRYAVDLTESKLSEHLGNDTVVYDIDGGYIIGDKIYNKALEEIYDLEDIYGLESFNVRGGNVYIVNSAEREENKSENETESETEKYEVYEYQIGKINSDGKFGLTSIFESKKTDVNEPTYIAEYGIYEVRNDATILMYNIDGEHIETLSEVASVDYAGYGDSIVMQVVYQDGDTSYYILK